MVAPRPRSKICDGEQHECKAARRPGRDRPAQPFEDFPEVVRAGDEPEPAALRYRIAGLAGPPQAHEGVVSVEIERKTGQENPNADQEAGVGEPFSGVRAEFRNEAGVDVRVDRIEEKAGPDHHNGRLPAACPDTKRIDERPVQIVALPHDQEQQRHDLERALAVEIDDEEERRRRQFHDDPCELGGNVWPPARTRVVAPVGRGPAEQVQERHGRHREDSPNQHPVQTLFDHFTPLHPACRVRRTSGTCP